MHVDEVIEVLQHGAAPERGGWDGPALEAIRAEGRGYRRRRRIATGAGVAGVAGVAAATVLLASTGSPFAPDGTGDVTSSGEAGADTALTAWEQRALDAVPGSYDVGGTVVVPGPVDTADDEMNMRFGPGRLAGDPVGLGWNGYSDPGYVTSTTTYPALVERRQMLDDRTGKDIVADNGPVSLGCLTDGDRPCSPAVLMPGEGGDWLYHHGLGTDDFLKPGSAMELFLDPVYRRSGVTSSLVGGFDGLARRVELTLVDGTVQAASIDAGVMSAGDTLFWAETPVEVARVTAYDDAGEVVQERQVRDCSGGVDCEVR